MIKNERTLRMKKCPHIQLETSSKVKGRSAKFKGADQAAHPVSSNDPATVALLITESIFPFGSMRIMGNFLMILGEIDIRHGWAKVLFGFEQPSTIRPMGEL
jgi:hypothetical protein